MGRLIGAAQSVGGSQRATIFRSSLAAATVLYLVRFFPNVDGRAGLAVAKIGVFKTQIDCLLLGRGSDTNNG